MKLEPVQMDRDGFDEYYLPAACAIMGISAMYIRDKLEVREDFDAMLGTPLYADYVNRKHSEDKPLPDNWKRLLTAIAGPYGKAILKAHQIKYGVEHVHPD